MADRQYSTILLYLVLASGIASASDSRYGTARNGTLQIERYSAVAGGKLLPGFLFMQGESDGLEQG